MKRAFDYITVSLFFTIIIMFAANTFLLSDEPATVKKLSPGNAEKYVERNFPLFENWRSLYSSLITGAGQNRIGNVYISDNGMIDIVSTVDDDAIEDHIEQVNNFAAVHPNISCFALIVPTASGIYSGELPMVVTALDQQKMIDDIYFRIDNIVQTLDAYNPLFSARDDYVYFRTDRSWTAYGAYTVYSKVIKKMGFSPLHLSSYDLEYADRSFNGNLYTKTYFNGVQPDFINIFRNKNGSFVTGFSAWSGEQEFTSTSLYYTPALNSANKLNVFLGGNSFEKYTITTSNTDAPKLLIIKGSYANMFVPFLTPHYSEITLIDPTLLGDRAIEDVVDINRYDQMLMLYDFAEFSGVK